MDCRSSGHHWGPVSGKILDKDGVVLQDRWKCTHCGIIKVRHSDGYVTYLPAHTAVGGKPMFPRQEEPEPSPEEMAKMRSDLEAELAALREDV